MSDLKTLQDALTKAKAAYKADKSKANKAAKKAAKQALAAAVAAAEAEKAKKAQKKAKKSKKKRKRQPESSDVAPEGKSPKKAKQATPEDLQAALDAAKKAYKADKSNAALKKAYKEAKKALKAASENKTQEKEKEPEAMEAKAMDTQEETDENPLAGLNKSKKNTGNSSGGENPPNPSLYCGNLSYDIDDDAIKEFFKDCGEPVDIHWLMDRETKTEFLGRGFVTFSTTEQATKALELNETECMGRPIRLSYAKPRTGGSRGKKGNGKRFVEKPLSARPDNCTTAFIGNVSFEIDDDTVREFAGDLEIKAIRWLNDRETGDFKGCGFVEFHTPEDVDEFVKLRGTDCMGRPMRIDYAASRPRRE